MSVFTSRVVETLPVPHDAGQSVTIQKLAPRHLEGAKKAKQIASLEDLRAMGGAVFLKELQSVSQAEIDREREQRVVDPFASFDKHSLIKAGVKGWTYQEPLEDASFLDLDDVTRDWLATAILRLSRPDLFVTADDLERDRKNA